MDEPRFDRWRRRRFGQVAGSAIAAFFGLTVAAGAKKKRKKQRKPRFSCAACADNDECISQRCVSLARICVAEDDSCTTGEHLLCGEESDPPLERASCQRTLDGNPICVRMRSVWCHSCAGHDDCRRQGWGPRGVCLSTCRVRCGESGPPSCAVPYGEPCGAPGEACFADVDCCSGRCEVGLCRLAPLFCGAPGTPCKEDFECCTGDCNWPLNPQQCNVNS